MGVRGGVSQVHVDDALAAYALNNYAAGDPLYVGKSDSNGKWLLQRFGETSGLMEYANRSNNTATQDYADAWINRATLVYGTFQSLTGV